MIIYFQLIFLSLFSLVLTQSLSSCEKAGLFSLTINGIPNEDLLNKLKEKRVQVTFFLNEPIQNDNKFILSKAIKDGHEIGILLQKAEQKANSKEINEMIFNIQSNLNIKIKYIKQEAVNEHLEVIKSLNDIEYLVVSNKITYGFTQTDRNPDIINELTEPYQEKNPAKDSFIYSISLSPLITSEVIGSFIEIIRQYGFQFIPLNGCLHTLLEDSLISNSEGSFGIEILLPVYQKKKQKNKDTRIIDVDTECLKDKNQMI